MAKISFLALTKEQVVNLINKGGAKEYTIDLLEDDIKLGAPINNDGTINFFDYGAWLSESRYVKKA